MSQKILITGACGFIGTNASIYFLSKGYIVIGIDNLSRKGAVTNLQVLNKFANFLWFNLDLFFLYELEQIFNIYKPDFVLHLAGQTAVTQSITEPYKDFTSNALGTLHVLESIRKFSSESILINASTNKVSGSLTEIPIIEKPTRYYFKEITAINEDQVFNPHTPYACSKACGEQYTSDYARIYNLKTITFRQSCIYGPFQHGLESQGWISWFIIKNVLREELTIFGSGKQVRDVLYIDDLLVAYDLAFNNLKTGYGKIYNIGGGPDNTISLLESLSILELISMQKLKIRWLDERQSDQKVYVSDISRIKSELKWNPQITPSVGIQKLLKWTQDNIEVINA